VHVLRDPEADLGMFSMFGRTGAPTKRGPTKEKIIVVCIAARVLNKMSMCVSGEGSWGWGVFIY